MTKNYLVELTLCFDIDAESKEQAENLARRQLMAPLTSSELDNFISEVEVTGLGEDLEDAEEMAE